MVRFKNRYIVCELSPVKGAREFTWDNASLYRWLDATILQIHGEYGSAAMKGGLTVKYYNPETTVAIIRSRHGPHKLLTSALAFAPSSKNNKITLRTLYVGASLSCCYKFLQKHQRSQLDKLWSTLDSADRQKLEERAKDSTMFKFTSDKR